MNRMHFPVTLQRHNPMKLAFDLITTHSCNPMQA